jgi:hypothetical protein
MRKKMKLTVTWDTSKELPVPTNDELELVAGLAIQEMYSRFGEKEGRFLRKGGYIFCAWQIGYKIIEDQFPLFRKLCEDPWKLIIQYLETEYRVR